ncbi:hypothetical protein AC578_6526 [Pseudocercospora eumusae]|nr:hypothetical protein AC578_6526 [Pseudocercospora eumusae]
MTKDPINMDVRLEMQKWGIVQQPPHNSHWEAFFHAEAKPSQRQLFKTHTYVLTNALSSNRSYQSTMLPVNAPRDRKDIVRQLGKGRLPDELILIVFKYVACDSVLPVVLEVNPQCCYSNAFALSKHLLGTPGIGEHHLLKIMEEALHSERHLLLDYQTSNVHGRVNSVLSPSQLRHIRHVELQVSIDPRDCYRDWALEPAALTLTKRIRRTLREARTQLPCLEHFRLTIQIQHWGPAPLTQNFKAIRDKEEPVILELLSQLRGRLEGWECSIKLQHSFRKEGVTAEEADLQFDGIPALTLHRIRQRTAASYTRAWLFNRFLRLSAFFAQPEQIRAGLRQLAIQGDSAPRISHGRWHTFFAESEVSLYYDPFTTAIITSPFYLNGCRMIKRSQPRLQRYDAGEIEARFRAAGGYVPRTSPERSLCAPDCYVHCSANSVEQAKKAMIALSKDLREGEHEIGPHS